MHMDEETIASRWYDKDPRMQMVLDVVKDFSPETLSEFSSALMQLTNIVRKNKRMDSSQLSIGKTKVLGLYKAFNKRRWYDQHQVLMNSLNILSTVSDEDFNAIIEGVLQSLNEVSDS